MQQQTQRNSMVLSVVSICTSIALMGVVYWLTGPGLNEFNEFNERIFGRYYTAGAILMIGVYSLAFISIVGVVVVATATAWIRKEQPRWLTWTATILAVVAPIVVVNLFEGT